MAAWRWLPGRPPAGSLLGMQDGDAHLKLADPAPGERVDDAEAAAALAEYREWSAAGRPGAVSNAEAKRLLLGESG
jgi:hypothetical protein